MLTYEAGTTFAHRLDPRTKLGFQLAIAVAAFAHTTPRGLVALTAIVAVVLAASGTRPLPALRNFRFALVLLALAPLLEGLTLATPFFSVAEARGSALASYRVLLVLLVSAAYIRTTPVRESRAAIQHTVPGRPGAVVGTGVAFVFRFLPLLQADLGRTRDAMRARLGSERPLHDRMRIVATAGLSRALGRADGFAVALQARCFSWNPTLPRLTFTRRDAPVLLATAALVGSVVV